MAPRQLSALLLVLAVTAQAASATYIGYINGCVSNTFKCTGNIGTLTLTNITSCNQVTVGCYASGCGSKDTSCPSCTDNGSSITLKCVSSGSTGWSSTCANPSEQTSFCGKFLESDMTEFS